MTNKLARMQLIVIPTFLVLSELIIYFYATIGPFSFGVMLLVFIPLFVSHPIINLVILLLALTFQSVLISIVSPLFDSRAELSVAQGLNFCIIVATAMVAVFSIGFNKYVRKNVDWDCLFAILWLILFICVFYLAYGIVKNGSISAAIYFRNATSVLFMIVIGWYFGSKLRISSLVSIVSVVLTAALVYGLFEFFLTRSLYYLVNADVFFRLKFEGRYDITDLEDVLEFAQRPLLNMAVLEEIGLTTFRVSGPNMHAISYAYLCAFAFVFFAVNRARWRMFMALFILLAIQAKGPLIIIFMAGLGFYLTTRKNALGWPMFFALNGLYSAVAFMIGTATRDFHVIGFMGGVLGFLRNPLGHGLGAGGNLAREEFSWSEFQNAGAATFGVESAVGVLLYQVGIATFIFLFFYLRFGVWATKSIGKIPEISRYRVIPIMGIIVVFNGIFQEEAYNFYSLGLIFFFSIAIIAANTATKRIDQSPFNPAFQFLR